LVAKSGDFKLTTDTLTAAFLVLVLIQALVALAQWSRRRHVDRASLSSPWFYRAALGLLILLTGAAATTGLAIHGSGEGGTSSASRASHLTNNGESVHDSGPTSKASDGLLEQLGVANVTEGDAGYSAHVTASYDQVLKVEIGFSNCHGRDELTDLHPSFQIPTSAGLSQTVSASVSDQSGHATSDDVTITLDNQNERLALIPDSLQWLHGTNGRSPYTISSLADNYLAADSPPLTELAPGGGGSLSVLLRVEYPGLTIRTTAYSPISHQWLSTLDATPNEVLTADIHITDDGDTPLTNMSVLDNLPPGARYLPGSTYVIEVDHHRTRLSDGIVDPISPTGDPAHNPGFEGVELPAVSSGPFRSILGGLQANLLPGQSEDVFFRFQIPSGIKSGSTIWGVALTHALGIDYVENSLFMKIQPDQSV
jgi:uncharacterized repeat protein (TIGR01451 family)